VIHPKDLVDLTPIERYVCYLYYTLGLSYNEAGLIIGHDSNAIDRILLIVNRLAWLHATPTMKKLQGDVID